MNDNARKWVEALRSGEFQQTNGDLRYGDKFDVLGVACELYRRGHPEAFWDGDRFFVNEDAEEEEEWLPHEVAEWLGVATKEGLFGDDEDSLYKMNDRGCKFQEIAALIEQEPTGLFGEYISFCPVCG